MWKADKFIYVKYIGEVTKDDLDLENKDEIFGTNEDGHDCDLIIVGKEHVSYPGTVQEINIDTAIKALEKLKKEGCNYVEILHHIDHHGYHFMGLNMSEADDMQVDLMNLEHKNKEIDRRKEKIAELKEQLTKLEKC